MPANAEIELKFLVPASARQALAAELAARGTAQRATLTAIYFDTPDLCLARAGLAWRLRREGRRWVQALKQAGSGALERFEHEVLRPDATVDAQAHADTEPGRQLPELLAGEPVAARFQTRVRRLTRRVRTRGAVLDIALDEGRITAGEAGLPVREVEFELVSGSPLAMLALVARWRDRFGLVLDPHNKAERGHRLAAGQAHPPLRKARAPRFDRHASPLQAFEAVFDECFAHIARNAAGLAEGDAASRADHVHQARVGIRRLRSALRVFRGWVPEPPVALVDGLRALFAALGQARDRDVLGDGVAAELARAGAPPLAAPAEGEAPDTAALVRGDATQRLLLDWLCWRTGLQAPAVPEPALKALARHRLGRWQRRIARQCRAFDTLDDEALHALRKQVKRQRYVLEFLAPLLPHKRLAPRLKALAAAQQVLGEINDLAVARERYRALVATDPAAWFAVGWLTARSSEAREAARGALDGLAQEDGRDG